MTPVDTASSPSRLRGGASTIAGASLAALGVGMITHTWTSIPNAGLSLVGPQFFPFLTGGLMTISGLAVVRESLTAPRDTEPTSTPDDDPDHASHATPLVLLSVVAILVAYAMAMESLGYLVSTFLMYGLLGYVLGARRWRSVLLVSLAVSGLSYILVDKALGLPLPGGIWG